MCTAVLATVAVWGGWGLSACARHEESGFSGPPEGEPDFAGALVFSEVTAEAGVDFVHEAGERGDFWLPEGIGSGGALFDMDEDGDLDLYLVQGGLLAGDGAAHGNRLYRNDGALRFVDVSEGSGAQIAGYGMGCAAADYDGDGDVDLYVTRLGANVLLRNDGSERFSDVTRDAGVGDAGFGTSAAFVDFDRDGNLDLYVVNYVDWDPARETTCFDPGGIRDYCGPLDYEAPSKDRLYRSMGDGRFRDVSFEAGIDAARGNGLGVLCSDFDGDGWVDIFVANDQTPAFLWMNRGDGTFLEDAAIAGCAFNADGLAIAGMGTASEDLDSDGDFDLVITNIHDQAHLALRNDHGLFTDVSHEWGFAGWGVPYTGFGIALLDLDHDGRLEGLVANGAVNRLPEPHRRGHDYAEPNQFLRRDDGGTFYDATGELGGVFEPAEMSRGLLSGDLDNDGDLDLVVSNNRGPVRIFRNECRTGSAWVMFDVHGLGRSRHALNARVSIEAGGETYLREVRPHASYLGTNDARVHIGLGASKRIDRLSVTWPDGVSESWSDVPVNRHFALRRGSSPEPLEIAPALGRT